MINVTRILLARTPHRSCNEPSDASAMAAQLLALASLGGYTTFSTASFETVRLIEDHRYVAAACNGLGMLIVRHPAAAALGFAAAFVIIR